MNKICFLLAMIFFIPEGFAWGPRGHHNICVAATRLVQNENLKFFLTARADEMGYLCNIPDIHWKSLPESLKKIGNPTHYINPEFLGKTIDTTPLQFSEALQLSSVKETEDAHFKIGSLWWRADQFFRLSVEQGKAAASSAELYEEKIFDMVGSMGVLGHFAADAAMPYHNFQDYDGWETGHGGIHSYYEVEIIDALDLDFSKKIYKKAKTLPKNFADLSKKSVVEAMRDLSKNSSLDRPKIEKLDVLSAPSVGTTAHRKEKAKRKRADMMAAKYENLILSETAKAAVVLAALWDKIYTEAGQPDLSRYKSYKYHHAPEFVEPDYLSAGTNK